MNATQIQSRMEGLKKKWLNGVPAEYRFKKPAEVEMIKQLDRVRFHRLKNELESILQQPSFLEAPATNRNVPTAESSRL